MQDTYGNTVSSSVDAVTLTAYTDSGCTTLATGVFFAASNPLTANGTTGTAALSGVYYSKAESIYLKASSSTVPNSTCSTVITVSPAAISSLAFVTQPSATGSAGIPLSTQPVIQLSDTYSNIETSSTAAVTLAAFIDSTCSTGASGTLNVSANPVNANGTNGTSTFGGVSYNQAGTIFLQASSGGASTCSSQTTLSASATSATNSTLSAVPMTVANDGSSNSVVTVTLQDANGNSIAGRIVSLASSRNSGGGNIDSFISPTVTSNAAGKAIFEVNSSTVGTAQLTAVVPADTVTLTQQGSLLFLGATPEIDLQPAYATSTLTHGSNPGTTTWYNLANGGTGTNGVLNGFSYTTDGWTGSGTFGSPYALIFNNGASYINLSTTGTGINNSTNFSFEAWINPASPTTSGPVILSNLNASNTSGMSLAQSTTSGKLDFTVGATTCTSKTSIPTGAWTWVGGTFNGATSTASLYINGILDCSVTSAGTVYTGSTNSLHLGASSAASPANFWSGSMADFRAYAESLSATVESLNYTTTASRFMPTNMQLWLRADQGVTTSGSSVAAWADQSPNAGTATPVPTSSPGYVANAVNGLPALSFNGTSQYLNGPSVFPASASYSIVIVVDLASTPPYNNILSSQTNIGGHAFLFYQRTHPTLYQNVGFTGTPATSTNTVTTHTYNIVSAVVTFSAGTYTGTTYVNGATGYTGTSTHAVTDTTTQIGAYTSTSLLNGNIAEAFLFSSALSANDLATVQNYLRAKYAISNPAFQLAFTAQPSTATVGTMISPPVTVTVEDDLGNTITNYNSPITLALSSNSLLGTHVITPTNGVAVFNNLSIDPAANGYTLSATSGTLTSATSTSFNVIPANGNYLTISAPANTTAGVTQTLSVTLHDQYGNTVTTSSAPITLAMANNPTGTTLNGTLTLSASAGVASFTGISIDTIGTGYTLAATSNGVDTAISSAFNILGNTPTQIALTEQPGNTVAGSRFRHQSEFL